MAAGSGSKLVNSNKAVTQSSAGNSSSWSFPWTAFVSGTGPVTFYAAIIVGEKNTKLCTLVIPESTGTGVEDVSIRQLKVYPNPFVEKINIDYALNEASRVDISLTDMHGRKVGEIPGDNSSAGHQHQVLKLPEGLPHGLYLLNIQQPHSSTTIRILQ